MTNTQHINLADLDSLNEAIAHFEGWATEADLEYQRETHAFEETCDPDYVSYLGFRAGGAE